jgi:hypothetical protein
VTRRRVLALSEAAEAFELLDETVALGADLVEQPPGNSAAAMKSPGIQVLSEVGGTCQCANQILVASVALDLG